MTNDHTHSDLIRAAKAEAEARSRTHLDHCILLALVTAEDIAAALIDQAIALQANAGTTGRLLALAHA